MVKTVTSCGNTRRTRFFEKLSVSPLPRTPTILGCIVLGSRREFREGLVLALSFALPLSMRRRGGRKEFREREIRSSR
jgi:hypothetical protein